MKSPVVINNSLSPLDRTFYHHDTIQTAQDLLGKLVVRVLNNHILTGIIVETEAYIFDDPACHAYRGKTKSNAALFGPVGHAYIYFIYGNHYCLNVVSHTKVQQAGGVLIRALQPVQGIEYMHMNRSTSLKNLTNGPGKLTQALGITKKLYGHDLTENGPLYISEGIIVKPREIQASTRIGISQAQEKPWRFYIIDNPFVSR